MSGAIDGQVSGPPLARMKKRMRTQSVAVTLTTSLRKPKGAIHATYRYSRWFVRPPSTRRFENIVKVLCVFGRPRYGARHVTRKTAAISAPAAVAARFAGAHHHAASSSAGAPLACRARPAASRSAHASQVRWMAFFSADPVRSDTQSPWSRFRESGAPGCVCVGR